MNNWEGKRFYPYHEYRYGAIDAGVYDSEAKSKVKSTETFEQAVSESIRFNESQDEYPVEMFREHFYPYGGQTFGYPISCSCSCGEMNNTDCVNSGAENNFHLTHEYYKKIYKVGS